MRKVFVFIFLLLTISLHSVGQSFQLVGGYSSVKKTVFEGNGHDNSKSGFFPGVGIEFGVGRLRINNTYTYSPRTDTLEFNGQSRLFQFHIITSDLAVKYKIFNDNSPYFLAGGFVSCSLYKPKNATGGTTEDKLEYLWNYGFVFGVGFEFFFKSTSLMIEGKYRRGRAYLEIGDMVYRTNEIGMSIIWNIY